MTLPADWARLSPLLDELLDLDATARTARLAALQVQDAALADRLRELLARDAALSQAGFLGTPAVPGLAALAAQSAAQGAALAAGDPVGPYTLERLLGEGGMGSVWLARRSDGRYEGEVAIKFLRPGLVALSGPGGAAEADRFAREGAILARLAHPHIARLLDAGVARDGALPYLVLEYVAGEPIDRWCDAQHLDAPERVRLMLDVLDAVAHAHSRLILHRDLKPSNILVTAEGRAQLLDFGIAKLLDSSSAGTATELTQRAGAAYTPHYAAPEQLQGGEVTTATDVYALGVLLYGLLGGGHPTTAATATPVERLRSVLEVEPRRLSDAVRTQAGSQAAGAPGGPPGSQPGAQSGAQPARPRAEARRLARTLAGDLDTIVARALKKAPAERYANAAALADDLRRWLAHEPIAARPDSHGYRLLRFAQRHRGGVAAGALVLSSLLAGLGLAVWQGREAQRQREAAEGLVAFMLGDLRQRLEPINRLDVLDSVITRVLDHYATQDASRLDVPALARRAGALQAMSAIAEKRGRPQDAQRLAQQAADSTGAALARAPDDLRLVEAHAASLHELFSVARERSDLDAQERLATQAVALRQRLVHTDAARADWRKALALAVQNQGLVAQDRGRDRDALAHYQQATTLLQATVDAQPANHFELALAHGWQATAWRHLGEPVRTLEQQRAKLAALARVPGGDGNRHVRLMAAQATAEIGTLLEGQGRLDEAEAALRDGLARQDALVAEDPGNLDQRTFRLATRANLADLLARNNPAADAARTAEALGLVRQAADEINQLSATAPDRSFWVIVLRGSVLARQAWLTLEAAASTAAERDAATAALRAYQADLSRHELAHGTLAEPVERRSAAGAALALGDLLLRAGQTEPGRAQWQQTLARLAPDRQRSEPGALSLLARAQLRLGESAAARDLATTLLARHPALLGMQRLRADFARHGVALPAPAPASAP